MGHDESVSYLLWTSKRRWKETSQFSGLEPTSRLRFCDQPRRTLCSSRFPEPKCSRPQGPALWSQPHFPAPRPVFTAHWLIKNFPKYLKYVTWYQSHMEKGPTWNSILHLLKNWKTGVRWRVGRASQRLGKNVDAQTRPRSHRGSRGHWQEGCVRESQPLWLVIYSSKLPR